MIYEKRGSWIAVKPSGEKQKFQTEQEARDFLGL
jgi:hypothetical protein